MADVFISYAKTERQLATDLAHYLEGEGYTVWWDTELTSGETFRNNIENELNAAKAVVVLWTTASVTRDWVIAEAEHGARRGNLIPLRSADLDPNSIPKPYSTRHTELIENRPAIIAALKRLNVVPRYAHTAGGSLHDQFWKVMEGSQSVADYEFYLKEFPEGPHAPFARLRIHQLQQAVEGQRKTKPASSGGTYAKSAAATLFAGLFFSAVILGGAWYYTAPVFSQLDTKLDRLVGEISLARKADDADWEKAEEEGLIRSWQAYLRIRPFGLHEAEAKRRIQERLKNRSLAVLSGHESAITKLEPDASGNSLASYDDDGWQLVWDVKKGAPSNKVKFPKRVRIDNGLIWEPNRSVCIDESKDIGQYKVYAYSCGVTHHVDLSWRGYRKRLFDGLPQKIQAVEDAEYFAAAIDGKVIAMSISSVVTNETRITGNVLNCIHGVRDMAALCVDRDVAIYRGERSTTYLRGHKGNIHSIVGAREGDILISGDELGEIRLWDISDLQPQ